MNSHTTQAGTPRPVQLTDLDPQLLDVTQHGRIALGLIAAEHDAPRGGRCPRCRWRATDYQQGCPSRVIARALRERTPAPAWLAHLAGSVPGLTARTARPAPEQRQAMEDGLPGLFAPPPRQSRPYRQEGGTA